MSRPQSKLFTSEEYLAWEAVQEYKHEYVNGEVFAMSGASDGHVTVTLNVALALKSHLRDTPCRVYTADMKLDVAAANAFFYPDVLVTCDSRDRGQAYYKSHPVLVVEVLSPSTAAFDRGGKFARYRLLDSLREYVLADPATFTLDVFRRGEDGHWVLYPYEGRDLVELASIGLQVPLPSVFEGVEPSLEPQQNQGSET